MPEAIAVEQGYPGQRCTFIRVAFRHWGLSILTACLFVAVTMGDLATGQNVTPSESVLNIPSLQRTYCWSDNTWDCATGPMVPGISYRGYPEDENDYFFVDLFSDGGITVYLGNYVGIGQLVLRDSNRSLVERWYLGGSTQTLSTAGLTPGRYYLQIFTSEGFSSSSEYTISASFPPLFQDDFNDGNWNGWQTYGQYRDVTNGAFDINADGILVSLAGLTSWQNYSARARFQLLSSHADFAIVAGGDATCTLHKLQVFNDRVELVYYTGTSCPQQSTYDVLATRGYDIQPGIWYDLRLDYQGSTLTGYLNNQRIIDAIDGYPDHRFQGQIGVRAVDSHVLVDDVVAYALPDHASLPEHKGYQFESGTQGWTTTEGDYKTAELSSEYGFAYLGRRSLRVFTELSGMSTDILRHTEVRAFFAQAPLEGIAGSGPIDLLGKAVSCFVYFPSAWVSSGDPQVYTRLYVVDSQFHNRFGDAISIDTTTAQQWRHLAIVVPPGSPTDPTDPFDPTQIIGFGLRTELQSGSVFEHTGEYYLDHCYVQYP